MAHSDNRDENSLGLSSSTISNLLYANSHEINQLISQIQTMDTREPLSSGVPLEDNSVQNTGDPEESSDPLKQLEDCSPPTDVSAGLGSLDLKTMFTYVSRLLSAPRHAEINQMFSPSDDQDKGPEGAADPVEEEVPGQSFQSKYIDFFPLYQDYYLQAVREDLQRVSKSFLPEQIPPQYLQGLQSHLSSRLSPTEVTPSLRLPRPVPKVTQSTLWQDLDEVKVSGLLSSLTTREIRLQESMFELIGSEASYLRSLGVAVNHFCSSKALKRALSPMEHHILFSNIRHVMAASERFLMDLEIRLGESILISEVGDIVLQHCPEFHSLYVPYVTNMMYQEALVTQLLQQNRDFSHSIRKLESDPACQRQTLKSFLVLPFQRITRIKLILEHIVKLTEPGSNSISNLEKAIEAIHEIVTECDKRVRKMKQIEELVSLEKLMDFDKVKSVPLVISGRFLVHQGPMKQLTVEAAYNSPRVSFISVYLHLFNDLLVISSKKDQRFIVVDHAKFPTHVHLESLKTDVLGLPPDSFLLHLSQSQSGQPTAFILLTHSRSDKEAWMKALSSEQ